MNCPSGEVTLEALDLVLVLLNHLLYHLTADRAGLTGGEFTVVSLLEVYAYFACGPSVLN